MENNNITIPERKTLEGIFEVRMTAGGGGNYFLNTANQGIALYQLRSGAFTVENLESLNPNSQVQVTGMIDYTNSTPLVKVDQFVVLKAGAAKRPARPKDPDGRPVRPRDPDKWPEKPERPIKKPTRPIDTIRPERPERPVKPHNPEDDKTPKPHKPGPHEPRHPEDNTAK